MAQVVRDFNCSIESSTHSNYDTSRHHWVAFSAKVGIDPWDESAITPSLAAAFCTHVGNLPSISSPKTISTYISGLKFHFLARRMTNAAKAFETEWNVRQRKGTKKRLAKETALSQGTKLNNMWSSLRLPITRTILALIKDHAPQETQKQRTIKRLLPVLTGGLLRLGEVTATRNNKGWVPTAADLTRKSPGLRSIRLPHSKVDHMYKGTLVWLASEPGNSYTDPVAALDAILWEVHMPDYNPSRPLFCDENGDPILATDVIATVKTALHKAGIDSTHYKGHSFRRGGAMDLFAAGVPEATIKVLGRWSSKCWKLYVSLPHQGWTLARQHARKQ